MERKFCINNDKENMVFVEEFRGTPLHSLKSYYRGDLIWGGIGAFWENYYIGVYRYAASTGLFKNLIGIHLAITRDDWRNTISVVGITISDEPLARGTFQTRWSMRSDA